MKAGDIVVTDFGAYQHHSVVSDRLDEQGKPFLISATKRTGTVREEPWEVVTRGKRTYVTNTPTPRCPSHILAAARSMIGQWHYRALSGNCEHFTKWAVGLEVSSSQVTAGVVGVTIGATLVTSLSKNPKGTAIIGGTLLGGLLFLTTTRAAEKPTAIIA